MSRQQHYNRTAWAGSACTVSPPWADVNTCTVVVVHSQFIVYNMNYTNL